jgi:hypothetical protein
MGLGDYNWAYRYCLYSCEPRTSRKLKNGAMAKFAEAQSNWSINSSFSTETYNSPLKMVDKL